MAIASIGSSEISPHRLDPRPAPASGGESFADTMTRVIREVNQDQVQASTAIKDLLVDGRGTIHDAMIAVNQADGSFRLLMELRNRLVEGVNQLLETRI